MAQGVEIEFEEMVEMSYEHQTLKTILIPHGQRLST